MFALLIACVLTAGSPEVKEQYVARTPDATVQHILALKPSMALKQAKHLAKLIDYWAGWYKVDPDLMVAIIRQESNFQPIRACWPAPWKGHGAITCDHGLAQVNQTWIERWHLDPIKLVSDDGYNVYIQARILAWFKHYYGYEQAWWARYHSATPSKRRWYLGQVTAFLSLR